MIRKTLTLTVVALFAGASAPAGEKPADAPAPRDLVRAKLVADADPVAAGEPFHLGVYLEIAKDWHVYWKHPGQAGMATEVKLSAPEGWKVAPLRWPEPGTFSQPGDITDYGYAEEVLLVAEVTPPEKLDAERADFSAEVSFLACKDRCVQGKAAPSLTLPVAEKPKPANRKLFEAWGKRFNPLAPTFTLTDQAGEEHTLKDYRGKLVVLEWFNPDCPFIKRHHAKRDTMADLYRKYADEGVVWLAVNSTHYMDRDTTRDWHAKWDMPFDVLIDRDGTVGRKYQARTTPHMFVINRAGEIVYSGAIDDDPRGAAEDPTNYVDKVLADLTSGRPVDQADTRAYGCSVKYAKQGG
ncbi:MAG: redoxin domain-containing protein [Planctomycetota bacterium]